MKLQVRTALVLSVVAILAALTGVGSTLATQRLITGKQIANGAISSKKIANNSITTKDILNQGVKTADLGSRSVGAEEIAQNAVTSEGIAPNAVSSEEIANGTIRSADIGVNQVTSENITLPEPKQVVQAFAAPDQVGQEFTLVDEVGSYTKEDPNSQLRVDWTGSAAAGFSSCQFQLRIDGAAAESGAGMVYVSNGSTISISASALFEGLGVGAHVVQVFARSTLPGANPCTVSPEQAGIDQTFVVSEEVG